MTTDNDLDNVISLPTTAQDDPRKLFDQIFPLLYGANVKHVLALATMALTEACVQRTESKAAALLLLNDVTRQMADDINNDYEGFKARPITVRQDNDDTFEREP